MEGNLSPAAPAVAEGAMGLTCYYYYYYYHH